MNTFPDPGDFETLHAAHEALRSSLIEREIRAPHDWRLTAVEQTIFGLLLKNDEVAKRTIVAFLYGNSAKAAAMKNMDVFIARIRRKTKQAGVKIETIFGVGYRLIDREVWAKTLKLQA